MTAEPQANQAQEAQAQSDKELNFERLRKNLEQEKRARAAAEDALKQMQAEQQKRMVSRSPEEEEDDYDEPYIDKKFLKRKFTQWEQQNAESLEKRIEEKARQLLESEKQTQYIKSNPDFYSMLTEEKVKDFADKHPAIAERMLRMPDNFDRQALLYEQIKAYEVSRPKKETESIQSTIDKNRRSFYYQPSGTAAAPYAGMGDFSEAGKKNAYSKLQEMKSRLRL